MISGGTLFNITEAALLSLGYAGIFYIMTLDSLMIPLGSEAVMTLAGVLAFEGKFNFWVVVVVALVASMLGSSLSWLIGKYGGRKILEKYGKYVLIRKREIERGDQFFRKHGEAAVMFGRLIPLLRTYISLPAGVARMPFGRFSVFTLAGSAAFIIVLMTLGYEFASQIQGILASESLYSLIGAGLVVLVVIVLFVVGIRRRNAAAE